MPDSDTEDAIERVERALKAHTYPSAPAVRRIIAAYRNAVPCIECRLAAAAEARAEQAEADADQLARDLRAVLTRVGMTHFSQSLIDGVVAEGAWESLDAHDAAVAARGT